MIAQSNEIIHSTALIKTALYEIITHIQQSQSKLQQILDVHCNTMRKSKDFVKLPSLTNTKSSRLAKLDKQVSQDGQAKKRSNAGLPVDVVQSTLEKYWNILHKNVKELVQFSLRNFCKLICQEISPNTLDNDDSAGIRLSIEVKFSIPLFEIVPEIKDIYNIVNNVIVSLVDVVHNTLTSNDDMIQCEDIVDTAYIITANFKEYFRGKNNKYL